MPSVSDGPNLDLPRLIGVLNRHEVEYLLVGGALQPRRTERSAKLKTRTAWCAENVPIWSALRQRCVNCTRG